MRRDALLGRTLNSALPVLLAFVIGGIVIAAIGENPIETYGILLRKSLLTPKGFFTTLHYASPLILTGLAIAVTFKANVYNMGVEGSMLIGAFFAGITGAFLPESLSPVLAQATCLLAGVVAGAFFALVPAALKAYFHVDEMVVTLMLNYALSKVLEFLSTGVFRDLSSGYVATPTIHENAMFSRIGTFRITPFFFIAIAAFVVMWVVMRRSKLGYEIEAMGKNAEFAEACGMRVRRKIITIMLISGVLAGLAGAGYMMSEKFKYTLDFSGTPGMGWDGMLIALLGAHSPVGVLVAAILYAALKTGADNINIYSAVPKEIVALIQGLIILFLAAKLLDGRFGLVERLRARLVGRPAAAKEVE